jgi:hypothetical protein
MSRGWQSFEAASSVEFFFSSSLFHYFHANKSEDTLGAMLPRWRRARFELWLFVKRFALMQPPSPSESVT